MIDEPGDHGASQAGVHCRHRIEEDPLSPVISHGFNEAPGYEEGLW